MKKLLFTCTLILFVTTIAHGQYTIYTDRASWEAAVASYQEEFFDDATLNPGITSSGSAVSNGVWADVVQLGYPSAET